VTRRFELRFASSADFERELESNLRRGRTFLPGEHGPADRSPCVVAVIHPESGAVVELSGEIVFAQSEGAYVGVGVDLVDSDLVVRLAALEVGPSRAVDELSLEPVDPSLEDQDPTFDHAEPEGHADPEAENLDPDLDTLDADEGRDISLRPSQRPSNAPDSRRGITVHERVRKLNPAARDKLARTGTLAERVALERAFGASIWEPLLENNQLTGAEVAKIAKNGMAPATVLAHIVGHAGWLAKPEVRRALLSNSRLPSAQAERVLRALSQSELRLVPAQAAYPASVRALARRLLQR